jgi:hypothetical protein
MGKNFSLGRVGSAPALNVGEAFIARGMLEDGWLSLEHQENAEAK